MSILLISSCRCSSVRDELFEELIESVEPLVHAFLHPGLDHPVAVLDRLEDGVDPQQGLAVVLLEGGRVQRHMSGKALELEGLHDALWRRRTVEDSVESELV